MRVSFQKFLYFKIKINHLIYQIIKKKLVKEIVIDESWADEKFSLPSARKKKFKLNALM